MSVALHIGFLLFPDVTQPPFDCGSPEKAGAELVARARSSQQLRLQGVEAKVAQAALSMRSTKK